MSIRTLCTIASASLLAFAVVACDSEPPPAPAPVAVAPPAPPPEPPPAPAALAEVGVAECDNYIKQMTACLGSMDPATKAGQEGAFTAAAEGWRATPPEAKPALAAVCTAALEAMPAACKTAGGPPAPAETPAAPTVEVKVEEKKADPAPNPAHSQGKGAQPKK